MNQHLFPQYQERLFQELVTEQSKKTLTDRQRAAKGVYCTEEEEKGISPPSLGRVWLRENSSQCSF